jgi:hypothetical protein
MIVSGIAGMENGYIEMIICSCLGIKELEFRETIKETKSLKKRLKNLASQSYYVDVVKKTF